MKAQNYKLSNIPFIAIKLTLIYMHHAHQIYTADDMHRTDTVRT